MADSLAQKKKFYEELSDLDNEEDDSPPDTSGIADALAEFSKPSVDIINQRRSSPGLLATAPGSSAPLPRGLAAIVKETPIPPRETVSRKHLSSESSTELEEDNHTRVLRPKRTRLSKRESTADVTAVKDTGTAASIVHKRHEETSSPISSLPSSEYEREQLSMAAPLKRGRKKKTGPPEIPEERRIFKNLYFCIFSIL